MPGISRRDYLRWMGAGATAAATSVLPPLFLPAQEPEAQESQDADRWRRMQWWHAAKFGMFIHWGLYNVNRSPRRAMEEEGIPVAEYERLAKQFKPRPNAASAWAKLARQAGQKYMVMTT